MISKIVRIFLLLFIASIGAAAAQGLTYNNAPAAAAPQKEALPTVVKKARGNEQSERPDWFALFHIWAKDNPAITLAALRDAANFENLAQFYACDYTRDFRHNDVSWPTKQVLIVQKFNTLALNPQRTFRLLMHGALGPYDQSTQSFVFQPLKGAAFSFAFPTDKDFGIEDDCTQQPATPQYPWPAQFVVTFNNPDFIGTLPMAAGRAATFLDLLPKTDKGDIDRRVVMEVEMTVTDFATPKPLTDEELRAKKPIVVEAHAAAKRAVIYSDKDHLHAIWRYGFATPLPQ